jgi:hypothetical protein
MTETLVRLSWAFPTVVLGGVGVMLLIKRFIAPKSPAAGRGDTLTLLQSMRLSESSTIHLVAIDGQRMIVIEGGAQVAAMPLEGTPLPRWRAGTIRRSGSG